MSGGFKATTLVVMPFRPRYGLARAATPTLAMESEEAHKAKKELEERRQIHLITEPKYKHERCCTQWYGNIKRKTYVVKA